METKLLNMNDKAKKMLCVLLKNIHDVEFQFGFYRYRNSNKDITINFKKDYKNIPAVTEPKYKWGIKVGSKVIKESYKEYYVQIATWRNGKNYEYPVPVDVYDKFKEELEQAIEKKLFKDINKLCNEQKEEL